MDGWTPQPVQCLDGVALKQLAAGSDFSLVLGSKGDVYAFGGNAYGQLGLGHNEAPVLLPQLELALQARVVQQLMHYQTLTDLPLPVFHWRIAASLYKA